MASITHSQGKARLTPPLAGKAHQTGSGSNVVIERQYNEEVETVQQSAPLLNIPAEIRNVIWEMATAELTPFRRTIDVRPGQDYEPRPGLLRVCRQTRAEASSIYYNQTKFDLFVPYMAGPPPAAHWLISKVPPQNVALMIHRASWRALKGWLRRYYEGESMGLMAEDGSYLRSHAKFFEIVEIMRDSPWETASAVLEATTKAMGSSRLRKFRSC